jgi:thymidylate kinase
MILLFEGIDCSGKSTAIDNILKYSFSLDTPRVFHFGEPLLSNKEYYSKDMCSASAFGEYMGFLKVFCDNNITTHMDILLDRFHFGELTYAEIFRGYTMPRCWQRQIEDILNKIGTLGFYFFASDDTISKRIIEKGDSHVLSFVNILQDRYQYHILNSTLQFFWIDTDIMTESEIWKFIEEQINYYKGDIVC